MVGLEVALPPDFIKTKAQIRPIHRVVWVNTLGCEDNIGKIVTIGGKWRLFIRNVKWYSKLTLNQSPYSWYSFDNEPVIREAKAAINESVVRFVEGN